MRGGFHADSGKGSPGETPTAHIRNALQILAGARRTQGQARRDWVLSPLEREAIERRLHRALEQLEQPEPRVTGRCEITADGCHALAIAAVDDLLELGGGA